jgi:chemotaxis protein CheC
MMQPNPFGLGPRQLDALREVANIGAGHAATALSQLTGHTIMINVPALGVHPRTEIRTLLEKPDGEVAAVDVRMLGELTGQTLLVFEHQAAKELAALLTMRQPGEGPLSELERSAVQEVGNILASAYLNALSQIVGGVLLPTPPRVDTGPGGDVVHLAATRGPGSDPVLTINTRFTMEGGSEVRGTFLVLPDHDSLARILEALRV